MEKIAVSEESLSTQVNSRLNGSGTAISELRTLLEAKMFDRLPKRFAAPMALDQLEMLEAELRNQGILSSAQDVTTLLQSALHTASILRWRARRAGISGDSVQFSVRVPQYILNRAEEIESELRDLSDTSTGGRELLTMRSATWGKGIDSRSRLMNDMIYLEQFAGYLLGRFEKDESRYHRGLNLLLKILTSKTDAAEDTSAHAESAGISLPIGHREFLDELKVSSRP